MSRAWLWAAGAIAIGLRLALFIATSYHPIVADSGTLVSPKIVSGTDLLFYQERQRDIFSAPAKKSLADYLPFSCASQGMLAGPLLPALLQLFRYENGNSWPLALFFLFAGSGMTLAWLRWLQRAGVSPVGLTLFAFLPGPIYYTLCVGTELPFCLLFTVFFISYFKKSWDLAAVAAWSVMLLLLLLTRPNALAILLFVILDSTRRYYSNLSLKRMSVLGGLLAAALLFGGLFFSYFAIVYKATATKAFFGVPDNQYLEGLYPMFPIWLDRFLSVISLIGAKILYLFGLRPSYSHVSMPYVLFRVASGLFLLPGFIYLFAKGEARHKALVFLFVLPILMVGSQERYSLPIQPLLFFYAAKAFGLVGPKEVEA